VKHGNAGLEKSEKQGNAQRKLVANKQGNSNAVYGYLWICRHASTL